MKEMVGGCCVCSDERGWPENPLVYCDGHGCNVAVHQACYGIVQVPTGPWFCRKCESQERAARVRCELCPLKDGALKRTDNMGWCHVVCALFIPEAWFANVQTMEPIMLKNVPLDRFNKMCYVCEENGREVSKASAGACMQCNKNGCRMNFHVTCAQAHGLLCEEAGNYGDNVKYCGYCVHHYKKLKRDANIKTIPAFRTIPADNATPDSTPEKSKEHKFRTSGEYKNMETIAGRQLASLSNNIKERALNATIGALSKTSSSDVKPSITLPGQVTVGTRTSLNSVVTVTESKRSTTELRYSTIETGQLFSPLPDGQLPASTLPVTTQTSFPTSLDGIMSSMVSSQAGGAETEATPAVRARRSRTGSLEKDKKVKRARVPTLAANKGNYGRPTQTMDVDDASPPTLRRGSPPVTRRVSPPVGRRVRKKTTDTVSTASSVATTSTVNQTLGPQNLSVFGGEPHFQSPISLASFTQGESSGLPSQSTLSSVAGTSDSLTASPLVNLSPATGPISSVLSSDIIKDKFVNGHLQGPPKIFPSTLSPDSSETPRCMEELLERQWEQGSNFLMVQGQHFDIASLLNCLHQLKSENKNLEEYVHSLMSRRDHLLAVNARLSLPFPPPPTHTAGSGAAPGDNNSGIQNISDDEMSDDSPINVVDHVDPPILSPPITTHMSTSHPFLTESLSQYSTSSLQNLPLLSSISTLRPSTPDNPPSSQARDKLKDKT